jgi:hypothetical protein
VCQPVHDGQWRHSGSKSCVSPAECATLNGVCHRRGGQRVFPEMRKKIVAFCIEMGHVARFSLSVDFVVVAMASTTMEMESSDFNSGYDVCAAAWERKGVQSTRPSGVCHRR